MLEEALPPVLISHTALKDKLPRSQSDVLMLDGEWPAAEISDQELETNEIGVTAGRLGYVMYTSGSTGRPKGVMVDRGGVTQLFAATTPWFKFDENDIWTLFHSFAFDFSVWEIWGPLLHGGRLVVVDAVTARSPRSFLRLLCQEAVTVLNQTPSAFGQLILEQTTQNDPGEHSLRVVIFGGEKLEPRMLRHWIGRNGIDRTKLVNMYGITEATIHTTYRPLTSVDIEVGNESPIGRSIPGRRVYLLDEQMQFVPEGVAGELYIGGSGVARGYLKQAELTAERFLDDPFSIEPGARMYKTGDLGRWTADGNIEYLGRNDEQVKVRGYRIELGDVEAALRTHPRVRQAVVIARERAAGQKELIAYIVGDGTAALNALDLSRLVRSRLPEYMAPAAYVVLGALPLTPNGKVDRRALPEPDHNSRAGATFEAPATPIEEKLATVWQELLRVDRVGRHDRFFDLGGHSLLIVRMIERLRQHDLSVDISLMVNNPSLMELAGESALLSGTDWRVPENLVPQDCDAIEPRMLTLLDLKQDQIDRIVEVTPGGAKNIKDIYPLTPLQEGILFHSLLSMHGDPYILPLLMVLESELKCQSLVNAIQMVVDSHDILRAAVLWDGLPRPVHVIHRRASLPIEQLDLDLGTDAIEQMKAAMAQDRLRVDLRSAPLIRATIGIDRSSERTYVLLQFHHLIVDHIAARVLLRQVAAILSGRPIQGCSPSVTACMWRISCGKRNGKTPRHSSGRNSVVSMSRRLRSDCWTYLGTVRRSTKCGEC